jgi:hypothetical protein
MTEENKIHPETNSDQDLNPAMESPESKQPDPSVASESPDPGIRPAESKTTDPVPMTEEQFMESAPVVAADETHDDESADQELVEIDDFSSYSREELVKLLEQYVGEVEVPRFKSKIAGIRDFLNHAFADDKGNLLEKFVEEGGNKDDFAPVPDPLEDRFFQAIRKFNKKRAEYHEQLEKQRQHNLTGKNEILSHLKNLIQNEENMNKAFERFHELQAQWRAIGPVAAAEVSHLQLTYKFLVDKFYDFIKINRELQDLDQRRNLETKIQLCEQADELLLEPSLNAAFRKLHQLQDKWRETGPVPREQKNEIWDRFKTTCDKLFEKRKSFISESDARRKQNYEAKQQLCEAVASINHEDSWMHREWQGATKKLTEIQGQWRKIGPADKKLNDEIWERFRGICDSFFKAKNEFYHRRKQELAANLQKKTELCIQAEALQNSSDWKTTTAELKRLQDEWKASGPVPDKHSDKIWKRFRTACDAFFNHKSDHFSSRDKEHEENMIRKISLIEQIESYSPGDDSRNSFEELKAFQRQWTELGMVPLNKKDEINGRYKKAIDTHFDKLKISGFDRQKVRYQEKLDHLRHSDDPKKIDHEKRHLMNKITELKNEVQLWENNIGFFAKSKNAEVLKSEFEQKIKNAKEEIESLKVKLDMTKES